MFSVASTEMSFWSIFSVHVTDIFWLRNDFANRDQKSLFAEIEKFITRQPPMVEKDDYDSENSWISDGLPSSNVETRERREDSKYEKK